ncbi:MAG: Purple acid phosphatase [Myxococcaceae bacterium]|nr:Purple acid phosphatase [Myxococcaceae bacterium]
MPSPRLHALASASLGVLAAFASTRAVVGCGTDGTAVPMDASTDAAVPEAGDAAIPCDATGVTKGPWVLRVDGTSAIVRWEACRAGTPAGVTFVVGPDGPSQLRTIESVETPFQVTETNRAPLDPRVEPDFAGTYFMHEANVTGLEPSTCYRYSLDADTKRMGRVCTAKRVGEPFRFLSIGDTNPGLGDSTMNVLRNTLVKVPDFTVHGGDIQYYDSTLETWASWFPIMQPLLSTGAFLPSVGNHESERPHEYEQYLERFFGGAGFAGTNAYYRFESGGVWFFTLDTEESLDAGSEQAKWFEAQLADAAAQPGYRFSVVYFHRPWVTCGDSGDNAAARALFEPMFVKYKVSLVIQAHMHGYERFELGDITYVTSAGGGGRLGNVDENITRPECSQRKASGPFFHAVVFDVTAGKLAGTVIDDKGAVRDTFEKAVP